MRGIKSIRLFTNIAAGLILAVQIVYLVIRWPSVPETVATHFSASGAADAFGSKAMLIVMPCACAALCLLIAVLERFPGLWNFPVKVTDLNRERLLLDGTVLTGTVKVLFALLFGYILVCSAESRQTGWPVYALCAALAGMIVFTVVQMRKHR